MTGTRGLIGGLSSPHPLASFLPSIFDEERPQGIAFPSGTYTSEIGYGALIKATAEGDSREHLRGLWVLSVDDLPDDGGPAELALAREGHPFATGTLEPSGNLVTLSTSDCPGVEGRYTWSFDGELLALEVVDDACAARRFVLTANRWRRESFVMRFLQAFDESLAPLFASLDNLDAYFDPHLAPQDFVDWLSSWVGLAPNRAWHLRRRRDRIAGAVELALSWGTSEGIREVVSIFAGVGGDEVEIVENGAVAISHMPGGDIPGTPAPRLAVRVRVPDPTKFDVTRLRRVVASATPAHMVHEVEVVKSESSAP